MTGDFGVKPILAVIGGTGQLGRGLTQRWIEAGYEVIVGSRDPAKARDAMAGLAASSGAAQPRTASYAEAAAAAAIVILTVPFAHQAMAIDAIKPEVAGKLVLDTTVPLMQTASLVCLPETRSAAVGAQRRLGDAARVVSAFHNVPASMLQKGESIDCDVLVFGDDPQDRQMVISLAEAASLRGVHGGPLANSVAAEALTSVLIGINRHYKARNAGIRITGVF